MLLIGKLNIFRLNFYPKTSLNKDVYLHHRAVITKKKIATELDISIKKQSSNYIKQ